ncbi:hypothetical protein IVB33_23380 [Bradyrhizobium sp. 24]|uniref:hypothetical protein n=1 Tax=unclassified Bradyrhizobium TaxID=2631580 RepID=UPI001FFB16D3|nr:MULTISPECIES: hypothetical protein [unclassified Bradyrhizobium]MCK1301216.1 hypothetical protein [Bradyrhizobium sp. 37]MCK1380204.1 hypothetical protein [Bradyrhizobium sp. 24]MCK1774210.1 hypothetical protein [Bradyrhizobium sp. 134]
MATIPPGLEILLIPGLIAAICIHLPVEAARAFPIPVGILTFDDQVIERIQSVLQECIPKEIGRFFVRDALREAIQTLKTGQELLEPVEREAASRLAMDSDRQGVPGSPDLAATIFEKIEKADVFLADVTLVGETPDGKKLINSNVAIEYGHAHRRAARGAC